MDTVYVETTVIGNVAGRMHPDPLVAIRQTVTRQWWATAGRVPLAHLGIGDRRVQGGRSDGCRGTDSGAITGIEGALTATDAAEQLADAQHKEVSRLRNRATHFTSPSRRLTVSNTW